MNNAKLLLLIILSLLTTTTFVSGQAGSLDSSFGNAGKLIGGNVPATSNVYTGVHKLDVAVQTDGKIVVAGTGNGFAVSRFNADGSPDAAFGANGRVAIDIYPGYGSIASALAIQPDGKIVVGGLTDKPTFSLVDQTDFAVARFNADGSLDNSFGNGNGRIAPNGSSIDRITEIVVQPDGKILFTGDKLSRRGSQVYVGGSLYATRLLANGGLDNSFGSAGTASAPPFNEPNSPCSQFCGDSTQSLTLQPDGKIIVIGNVTGYSTALSIYSALGIVRFLPDGQLDNAFGTGGKVATVFSSGGNAAPIAYNFKSVAVQTDGKIVVGGKGTTAASASDFAVFRYTTTGELDATFDGDGRVLFSIEAGNDAINDILIQRNGKIVAVGESSVSVNSQNITNFAVARFNANGSPDVSFDGDGKATTDINNGDLDSISRAVIQTDGKILAVGFTAPNNGSGSISRLAITRYIGDTSAVQFDFDGDRRADVSVFRPSNGFWYRLNSSNNSFAAVQFGQAGDKIAPADYDGDGKTDIAVFRENVPGAGDKAYFYILNSADNSFRPVQFGTQGDVPVAGDWDGDGRADVAVYRASPTGGGQSNFYYQPSTQPTVNFVTIPLGVGGDRPVPADYDGDGRLDPAVFRSSNATWYVLRSSINQIQQTQFGLGTDVPVPADYDGDGAANIAVFRPSNGTWYTSQSSANNFGAIQFGTNGDLPVAADYDGDGRADVAVFRPSNGAWYLNRTTSGFTGVQFGANGDRPALNALVP